MQELNLRLRDWLWLIPVSLLVYVTPVPGFGYMRVDGMAILAALFSIYRHRGLPLVLAFSIGLLQDIVSLAPLGQHAIGLVVIAYVAQSFRDRIRMQSLPRQLSGIFMLLLLVKFIHSWVAALGFGQLPTVDSFLSVVVTTAFWPLLVRTGHALTRGRRDRRVGLR